MTKPTIVSDNSKPRNFFEAMQAAIINRYTSSKYGKNEPVVYEFTQDRALLHQYHILLNNMYRKMYNAYDYKADADVYDKLSYVLIARRGKLCLGGCRLTVREHDEMWKLPLESDSFKLRDLLPDHRLGQVRHAEMSRFVVMEDCGEENILYSMSKIIIQKSIELENYFIFAKSTYQLARNWRMIATHFGLKGTRIYNELDAPTPVNFPDEQKWYVIGSDLKNFYNQDAGKQTALDDSNTEQNDPSSLLRLVD